ncbi:purine-nucleoside phosphorylase [Segetibacter sp.]|uniref:purine-nucleoside phosphorylase n=1 Tax=Segetibacter sp. TaxID=2231182 RepID=UPI0026369E6D|nr:purine-nucleoside phosphorylase [Segetibacter sp.]MCW3080708.1 purine nucleoside phosphorylase [Segetibacter sp.]
MIEYLQQIKETATFLIESGFKEPVVGIVLGTGLSELVNHIEIKESLAYEAIPNFPLSTVEFHKGNLVYGKINGVAVVAMQGRFHYYEGYSMQQITFPIRVMKAIGVKHLLLSNAAGGINTNFKKGHLVLLDDHINLQPENPLRGLNLPEFGNRFPDMSQPYNKNLNNLILQKAREKNLFIHEGTYASVVGPNLETRAEYRYIRSIGADLVGMSTVPEVIVANQLQLPCACVSVITDECDPDNLKPVDIREIIAVAGKADKKLSELFAAVIAELS